MSSSNPLSQPNALAVSLADRLAGLQEISLELVNAKDTHSILQLVVARAIELLSCDAGSLYLKEAGESLSFEVALNKSIEFNFRRASLPLSRSSIAQTVYTMGQSMNIADAYAHVCPEGKSLFDDGFDRNTGYRTRTILAVPLRSSQGRVLGVLQLINRKDRPDRSWPSNDVKLMQAMPLFSEEDQRLIESFAAVATSAIENTQLKASIENLFESFIRASVLAIDSRDPGTRGHSERVTQMTVALAKKLSELPDDDLADVKFSEIELKELYYAGLLHDFGKIAVREATLQKEQKLTELQRFKFQTRTQEFCFALERRLLHQEIFEARTQNRPILDLDLKRIDQEVADFRAQLAAHQEFIFDLSRPTVLDENRGKKLDVVKDLVFESLNGPLKLLTDDETEALRIGRGCLTDSERAEIESHVTHSYNFLSQIPWDHRFARVPEIAFGHHELLDGTGYPRKLKGSAIPVASRIMTICDMFDALASSDRPYKKALSTERTLEIIRDMVKAGKIEARFFKVFCDYRIWETCTIYLNRAQSQAA